MIPLRISVQGFLCYRDEQEICFDNATLWLLAGLNGSGKSAVFDGVTYALFGGHRAGKKDAEELINKSCDRAAVEFDFQLDGQTYRIRRTLKRKKQGGTAPTHHLFRWHPGNDGEEGEWKPIPDTSKKPDFDAWIKENVGLTYETFTSSVLLMQGKAENLLSAQPKERFEVLASIVDLDRYQSLHERADEQRKQLKEKVELLQKELDRLAEVSDAELAEAELAIADADEAVQKGQAAAESLQRLEVQAEQWRDWQTKLTAARQQSQRAEQLLADADAIERDWTRLRELRLVLPQLRTFLDQRERLAQARQRSEQLSTDQRALAERLGQTTTALEEKRRQREQLQQTVAEEQQREQVIGAELRAQAALLACVNLCEKQRQELARLDGERAKLPADPAALLGQAQKEHERLALLGQVVPLLCRFRGEREELRHADQAERAALAEQTALQQEGEALKTVVAERSAELEQVAEQRRAAEDRASAARALLDQAQQQFEQLDALDGEKSCRHCGQALTAEHLEDERCRRRKALAQADADLRRAIQERTTAAQAEVRLLQEKQEKERALEDRRERYRECRNRQQTAEHDAQRRGRECLRLSHEIAEPFRGRISSQQLSNWLTTTYPGKEDIDALQHELRGKSAAARRLQEVQEVFDRWRQLTVERDTTERALTAQEATLPADRDTLRHRHAELEAEDVALKASLKSRRAETKALQDALERLDREQRTIREQLADKGQQASAEEVRAEECQKAQERARTALPETWQTRADRLTAAEVQRCLAEQQTLERAGTEARGLELAQARTTLETLRQRVAELEEEAAKVPADAHCDPAEVKKRRTAARQEQVVRESSLLRARQERDRLAERRDRRRQLAEEHAVADRQYHLHRLLADLLGRNRLQLYLVRQAERGIVDYANAVLDRLSGGQLYLRLRGDDDSDGGDQALDLEAYNRSTGQAPIGVSFLSGSQRFRVAVSLALGIGQYASRQHRPIESVIIDEGFGCLDRQGRQVMIQELQNLRGQLRCILLVSHQEEFVEAFADGYHFTLNDGSTQVKRFGR